MFHQTGKFVRSVIAPLLILLIHASVTAQPATRLGVYDGMGFTVIRYDFLGKEHDRGFESMAVVGITAEIPLAKNLLLAIRPAFSTLNGLAGLAARVPTESGSRMYRSEVKEQWIVEIPFFAKAVLDGREARPYVGIGGFLDINSNPAEIRLAGDAYPSLPSAESYAHVYGGLFAAIGVELDVSSTLLITPEIAVRQLLSRPIDTELLTQDNTPRFLLSVGLLFPLSHERW
ncbi:MAG: hypothetical protein JXA28_00035 [Bacteroidetes bacterium]|nr:hypothetical protein [Bacteroidota bacterium]